MADFTHLHVHTEYSLLDGVNRIPDLIDKVKNDGMEAVAMTDHGVMNGYVEFWQRAKDSEIKPILGCEVYVAPKERTLRKDVNGVRYYHLVMLAQNKIGFQNLVKMVSLGHKEGYYYNPRIDRELMKKYNEGIIVTSACLASPIARNISRDNYAEAEEWLQFFKETFPGRFFLELQRNGHDSDEFKPEYNIHGEWAETIKMQIKVNKKLREYAAKYDLPLVATTDAHFLNEEDKDVQKVLFCIQDGITLDDPKGREGYIGTYVTTQEEMLARFADDRTPLDNTMRIAEMVEEFDINHDRVQPQFWNLPKTTTAQEELKRQTYEGAKKRYGEITDALKERIDYELDVIHQKGYDDYFLVVGDLLQWSERNGIATGTRGSVTGSVVAYCLDIVKIDPIKWELYFERFLNPERPSPPDIDMDIQDSRRDELLDYTREKYGEDAVVAIATFGRFQTKAAIRDVARVMGIDLAVADKLSKMVDVVFGKVFSIDKQMETDPEFKQIIESDPELMRLADYVRKITGLARNQSVHAAGYLITPGPIIDYTPIMKASRGEEMVTEIEGPAVEDIGLMKFDYLGLRTLTILARALEVVEQRVGVKMKPEDIPDDDKKTFELFSRGETTGIFQFESPPMRKYLMDLEPEIQEDLCFMAAAYRPGPMQYIPDYILRKNGKQEVEYLTPEMEEIVGGTYGFAIYQEQVMRIAVDIAGYSMGRADLLRRAMSKKKMKVMKQEEPVFKKGIMDKGYSQAIADELWEYLLPFADYGFNKAHAAAYAVLAYKCAYLKAHYPLEFMTALMHSDLGTPERITVDIQEAGRLGFEVLQPDINKSGVYFEPEGDDRIRFGMGAVKNVGVHIVEAIVEAREKVGPFKNLDDFIDKVGPENLSRKAVECLIKVGAMDDFGPRNGLLAILNNVFDTIVRKQKIAATGQIDMFGVGKKGESNFTPATKLPNLPELTNRELVQWERELMGVYLSTHPLDNYYWIHLDPEFRDPADIGSFKDNAKVKVLASIDEIKIIRTKAENKRMAFLTLDGLGGRCEAVVFPKTFEVLEPELKEAMPFVVEGTVSHRNDTASILVNKVLPAVNLSIPREVKIDITGLQDKDDLERLKPCFQPLVDGEKIDRDNNETEVTIKYGSKFKPKRMKRKLIVTKETVKLIAQYVVKDELVVKKRYKG